MIGRTLSHFCIVEKIGEGGMGVVYRAEDTKLRRQVALKVLPPELVANEERRLRFLREARAAAAVTHPNIATIFHVDEADGVVFIAMELVEGKTLREHIGGRPMPIKDALRIATEIAEGLARAHQAHVIHRDLKPDNVIVGTDGHAKILDFGLAKLLEERPKSGDAPASKMETISGELTREGKIFGTAAYMSPEQARGQQVDARSDIFSFGTMLYEMVTGRIPFAGKTNTDILSAIIRDEPVSPSQQNREVPDKLDDIVVKCLDKDPERRYQSAKEIGVDLRRLGTPSGAVQPAAAVSPGMRSRAVGLLIAIAAAAALVLLVGFNVGGLRERLFGGSGAGHIESLAVLPLENLSGDPEQEYFADGMTDALITDLSKIGALKVISRTSAMRYKGSDKSLPQIARELGVDGLIEGSVLRVGDRVRITAQLIEAATDEHLWAESYERNLRDVLALQGDVARAIAQEIRVKVEQRGGMSLTKTRTLNPDAYEAYLKGRYFWYKRTEQGLTKGLEYFQKAIELDPGYAPAYAGLADAYIMLGAYSHLPPTDVMPKAKAAALKALGMDDTLAEAHTSLARILHEYDWDWLGAEKEYKRAVNLNPNYALAHMWYARLHRSLGQHDEAIEEAKRSQQVDPLSLLANSVLGEHYYYAQRSDDAIRSLRKTLEMDPNFFHAHVVLGEAYLLKGKYEEGITALRKGLELSGGTAWATAALGHAHALSGNRVAAQELLDDLKRQADRKYIPPYWIAVIYVGLGENDLAIQWLERSYEERDPMVPSLGVYPKLEILRSDPRFADLLRRIGLPYD